MNAMGVCRCACLLLCCECVCACVRACVRVCVRACVRVCVCACVRACVVGLYVCLTEALLVDSIASYIIRCKQYTACGNRYFTTTTDSTIDNTNKLW